MRDLVLLEGVGLQANNLIPENIIVTNPVDKPRTGWIQRQRLKQRLMDIDFGTWNTRTLNKTGALKSLLKELIKYNIKLAAIQETRWQSNYIADFNTHTIYSSGTRGKEFGVAFIVEKELKTQILDFKPVNERICTIRVKSRFHNLSIINVHAPTEDKNTEIKDEFYQKLTRTLSVIPSNDIKIIMGDFNAKVGREEQFIGTIGKQSLHEVSNDNGSRLVDFASSNGMVISSTFFPHKNIHKRTWSSPDGRTHNQIDHVLIEKRGASSILDVRTWRGATCGSDHYLVKVRVRAKISTKRQNQNARKEDRFDCERLKEYKYRKELEEELDLRLAIVTNDNENINDIWESIKNAVKTSAKKTIGIITKKKRNDWFDKECEEAIERRNKAYREYIDRPTRNRKEVYAAKRKIADKVCRKKKREMLNAQLLGIQCEFHNNNLRQAYQRVKTVTKEFQPRSSACRDAAGNLLSDPEKIKRRWKNHFQELLNTNDYVSNSEEMLIHDDGVEIKEPDMCEIENIIKKQRNNKAPGKDGIVSELIKYGGRQIQARILHLMQRIWKEEVLPEDWKTSIICPIYKKGCKQTCSNYRGISLLSVGYKIFTSIIRERLETLSEKIIGEYQAGFRKSRSTSDQIFSLKQILEKCWERNVNVYQIFIDFKQAYDSIDRTKLCKILVDLGIPTKLVRLIKLTMTDTIARVKVQGELTESFKINQGVKQGDGLAPTLFNLALEWIIRKTSIQRDGTITNKSVQLIGYADDLNVVGRSLEAVRQSYKEIKEAASEIGLIINEEKTKAMMQTRSRSRSLGTSITIEEHNIEVVNRFVYLGSTITDKNEEIEEVQRRLMLGNKAYMSLRKIFKSREVHRLTKFRLYKTLIRPVVYYGSESWTLSQKVIEMLDIFERKVLRWIVGPVKDNGIWRIRYNNELYQIYNDMALSRFIQINRLRWAGHIARMPETRVPKKLLDGKIDGQRSVGRPRKKWTESVAEDAKNILTKENWRREARERDGWRKSLEEAKARIGL